MPQRSACSAAASPAATVVRLLPSVSLLVSLPSLPSASEGASSSPLSADASSGSPAAALAARSCHHLQQGWGVEAPTQPDAFQCLIVSLAAGMLGGHLAGVCRAQEGRPTVWQQLATDSQVSHVKRDAHHSHNASRDLHAVLNDGGRQQGLQAGAKGPSVTRLA